MRWRPIGVSSKIIPFNFIEIDYVDKRIEAVLNAAHLAQISGIVPDCCYQVSEGIAYSLNEMGFPDAKSMACDVYGWNHHFTRAKSGEAIVKRIPKHQVNRHPQRGGRKKKETRIWPYCLAIHHEQEVEGTGYDGHVVAMCDGWVLDSTAGQFTRPAKKVLVPDQLIIPLKSFVAIDPALMTNGWCEWIDTHDVEEEWFSKKSIAPELVSIGSMNEIKPSESGFMAICLRLDIDSDNWMLHTPQTKTNLQNTNKIILELSNQILKDPTKVSIDI